MTPSAQLYDSILSSACMQMAAKEEAAVKMPNTFQAAGSRLLGRVAELIGKLGGHTLAAYADTQNNCHYFASSMLEDFLVANEAADFLRYQLVEQHQGGQPVISHFTPYEGAKVLPLVRQASRLDAWKQRMPTIQAFVGSIKSKYPSGAFFIYMQTGPSPNAIQTHQYASQHLKGILTQAAWLKIVGDTINTMPAQAPEASTSASMSASTSAASQSICKSTLPCLLCQCHSMV